MPATELLRRLAHHCAAALADDREAQAYLHRQGITDPALVAAYRIGSCASAPPLSANEREVCRTLGLWPHRGTLRLVGAGIILPTSHPERPEEVVGLLRVSPGHQDNANRHRFITEPRGLACPAGIGDQRRVVVVDAPLLALRLAQAGVTGVCIAHEPSVLPEVLPWLAGREVVLAADRRATLETMRAALGPLAERAQLALVHGDLRRVPPTVWALLGRAAVPTIAARRDAPAPLAPTLLRDLWAYARERVEAGVASAFLARCGLDHSDTVSILRLGYLPPEVALALPAPARDALRSHRLGESVVVPAYDEHGVVVDLAIVRPGELDALESLGEPQGLIAPAVATSSPQVVVTDSLGHLAQRHRQGERHVVLLRGVEDARRNAERLARSGVRIATVQARRYAEDIALALRGAGIASTIAPWRLDDGVAPVALGVVPPPAEAAEVAAPAGEPALLARDVAAGTATYRVGATTYVVEVPWQPSSVLTVTLRVRDQVQRARGDLAAPAERRRIAASLAGRAGAPVVEVDAHLVALLAAVEALVESERMPSTPAVAVSPAERDEAMALLRAPDLLDRIAADLDRLGWVGEDAGKRLLYLAGVSRKLSDPLWVQSTTTVAGTAVGVDLLAALTPPEDVVRCSRISDTALRDPHGNALAHRLLIVDRAEMLNAEAVTVLQVLRTRGAFSVATPEPTAVPGRVRARIHEARGPVALVASSVGERASDRLAGVVVPVDESPSQTARVLAWQRQRHADAGAGARAAAIIRRHHALQRLLPTARVTIPYAERVVFPSTRSRSRRDQAQFLALVSASALLHRFQRVEHEGAIVAEVADFDIARRLWSVVEADHQGLGRLAQRLLVAMTDAGLASVTMADLARLLPDCTRYAHRAALRELLALEYVTSPRQGRGRERTYRLLPAGAAAQPATVSIHLREVGELAKVGDSGFANLIPSQAVG